MDIQYKKNEMENILQDIISEYNRINDETINADLDRNSKLKRMSQNILSLEASEKGKTAIILERENDIRNLKT